MKRGRPPKPATARLSKVLRHRLTKAEYQRLKVAAKRAGLSVSEYARKKLLESEGRRPNPKQRGRARKS